ncbi:MAG: hypothetical protein ACI85O_002590 [Saprospiraceae bacterium]|jgi:hypothetical protein
MKVGELREKLAKLKKEEITKLVVEFYKLIPKAKKEDYDVDSMVNNPTQAKKAPAKSGISLFEMEDDIPLFIEHAKGQYYFAPNQIISKKERPKWRFKVKRWYKELINTKRADKDVLKQSILLKNLYDLLCESCRYQYFSGYDSFDSVGVPQTEFFNSVVLLRHEAEGKVDTLKELINCIVKNTLNRHTLKSFLIPLLIEKLDVPALKMRGIEHVEEMIEKNKEVLPKSKKNRYSSSSYSDFHRQESNNDITKFGYYLYSALQEADEAILFYHKHYMESSYGKGEIELYVLVDILFSEGKKDYIVREVERAIEKDIQPREGLIKLVDEIKKNGKLPRFIPR